MNKQNKFLRKKTITLLLFALGISFMAQAQLGLEWAKSITGSSYEYGYGIALDGSGNVYVTGNFKGTVDFNPGPGVDTLTSILGGYDAFIAKYDAAGNYVWAKSVGGTGTEYSYGIAVDDSANIYITGSFMGTADFDPGSGIDTLHSAGSTDIFLAKYDKDGNHIWAYNMGGSGDDEGYGVAVDESGNVYITGHFFGVDSDFNPGAGNKTLASAGGFDAFVAKYDPAGNYIWAEKMGGVSTEHGRSVAVDKSGNVYVTGFFNSKDFSIPGMANKVLTSSGSNDVFVAKFDKGGNYLWAGSMGAKGNDQGYGIAVDGSDNVYVTGMFANVVDFNWGTNQDTMVSVGGNDVFVAKYDTGGNYVWARSMGGSGSDCGYGITVDGTGHVYVTGNFRETADFNRGTGADTLTGRGITDMFVTKYDTSGNYEWAGGFGSSLIDYGQGVAVDGSGNVYCTGYFSDVADFYPGTGTAADTLVSAGSYDVFILKLACADTSSSYHTIATCEASYTLGDSVYTDGGIYTQVFHSVSGCDSTITLDLTFYHLNPVINVDGFTLSTTDTFAAYQWIKDGVLISGATNRDYSVTANGKYQVAVTNREGCSDTSAVYLVTNWTGIKDVNTLARQILVYPNPPSDMVYIQSPVQVNVTLMDIAGRTIRKVINAQEIPVNDVSDGVYFLRITNQNNVLIKVAKVTKQGK